MTVPSTSVAYLCLEFGLKPEIKTYCGGLGILAGDTIKSAADLGLNMFGVSILYKKGWFKQQIEASGEQQELEDLWNYEQYLMPVDLDYSLNIAGEKVKVKVWKYEVIGITGHSAPVYFLDTDLPENSEKMRKISENVYPSDKQVRIAQEMLLGIGGVQILELLGHNNIQNYHCNESHSIFACLELKRKLGSWDEVKKRLVFTTHTPLATAHTNYSKQVLQETLGDFYVYLPDHLWLQDAMNMTSLALFSSKFSNGVSKRHNLVTSQMYPDYKIDSITNGIHVNTWVSKPFSELFSRYVLNWQESPENLKLCAVISASEIAWAHEAAKQSLFQYIYSKQNILLDPKVFTIGFARRMVGYKRANFIFTNYERLLEIAKKMGGLQIVFSGKAYPNEPNGEEMVKQIYNLSKMENKFLKIVYLQDYNMEVGHLMTSGVDIWLNNPIVPLEASGTSGMKASLNGVPNISTMDGWWVEGWTEGVTGWALGENEMSEEKLSEAQLKDLYDKLENVIIPLYKDNFEDWLKIQRNCIAINASHFNTNRMLNEYLIKAYLV
jgi:glycogen phosphorylase